jgi:hypothetical protein
MRPVALDNLLYVTSPENAQELKTWQERFGKKMTEELEVPPSSKAGQ